MMVRNASNKAMIVDVLHLSVVRLAAAVHATLSPLITEMKEDLAAVKTEVREDLAAVRENLTRIEGKVDSISRDLEEHKNKIEAPPLHQCGGTGGWRHVVYLNMTDNTCCPSGWRLTRHSKTTCGKISTSDLSCDSVFFPVSGGNYTSVCGSIRAYQYNGLDAFEAYHKGAVTTIDEAYVAGVSLTHGSPRQHIWTFAAGVTEDAPHRDDVCPCDASINITIPTFVGGLFL